ncbi:hypothetical protein [Hymenobacter saemangeumensis]
MKLNWYTVAAAVLAGVVVLLIQEYAFKRTVNDGVIESKLFFQE